MTSTTLKLIELVEEVQNLLSPDVHSSHTRVIQLLNEHKELLADPCQPLSHKEKSTDYKVELWRQGSDLPSDVDVMEKQIKCLESLKTGGKLMKLSAENQKIQKDYFDGWSRKQCEKRLTALQDKIPFVKMFVQVVDVGLKSLQDVLSNGNGDTNKCSLAFCQSLWIDAHKALWNPNSEIRSKLETFLGQRLEAYLNIGGLGSAAKLVGWFWPSSPGYRRPVMIDIEHYHAKQINQDQKHIHQYRKEIELEMELAARMAFLQREMALDVVKDLMEARQVQRNTNGNGNNGDLQDNNLMNDDGEQLSVEEEDVLKLIFKRTNRLLITEEKTPNQEVKERIKGALPMKLMESVPRLISDVQSQKGTRAAHAILILKNVARCLFIIFYHTQMTKIELKELVKTVDLVRGHIYSTLRGAEDFKHGWCTDHIMDRIQEHELFNVALLFLLTFICGVDPADRGSGLLLRDKNYKDGEGDNDSALLKRMMYPIEYNRRIDDPDDLGEQMFEHRHENDGDDGDENGNRQQQQQLTITQELSEEMDNPFTAVMKMSWLLLRVYVGDEDDEGNFERVVPPALVSNRMKVLIKLRPFTFLNKLLSYNGIKHDGHRDVYSSVIYELFGNFLQEQAEASDQSDQSGNFCYVETRSTVLRNFNRKIKKTQNNHGRHHRGHEDHNGHRGHGGHHGGRGLIQRGGIPGTCEPACCCCIHQRSTILRKGSKRGGK